MNKITSSATKITLLLLIATVCTGLFARVITEETFKLALVSVLSFYFGQKTPPTDDTRMQG